ncbi:ABC transporter permease [Halostella salina]|uniref:ABC transporter permease n=1 Tax=Halostella salina TaxID=1547897 RepID=UPI000EF7758A|nr:ABC transporter permease [Halostella salina]
MSTPSVSGPTAGRLTLLRAVLVKKALLLVRYPVNTLSQIVSVYLFFAVIFFGGRAAASSVGGVGSLSSTLDGLVVGWFLWTMSLTAYFGLAMNVTRESQWGTLEQLYMSPYGFGTVMGAKVVANVLESLVWGGIVLALMLLTTDRTLAVDLLTVVPISVFAVASVVGIGFVFAGLAMVYKRVENVTQLMQFVLIALIAAPVSEVGAVRFLPLSQGSAMLQSAMRDGVHIWEFSATNLAVLVGTGVGYAAIGYAVFAYCTGVARRRGVMGDY